MVGLALSGGGFRAAVYHLGVLRRLAEAEQFENIKVISTVSGGSLVIALIYSLSDGHWPSSKAFLDQIYPQARKTILEKPLVTKTTIFSALFFHPLLILQHRAMLIAKLLGTRWSIGHKFSDLDASPNWIVNTTSLDSGKNWRFSREYVGDWKFGRNYSFDPEISVATAASAAVPYAIGRLKLKVPKHGWYEIDPATSQPKNGDIPPIQKISLWDGGVYENLGIEPVYKESRGLIGCDTLIVSDGGAPFGPTWETRNSSGLSFTPRLFSIATSQIRALRARDVVGSFIAGRISGCWIQMGVSAREFDLKSKTPNHLNYDHYLNDQDTASVANVGTHLSSMTPQQFDLISRHGFEVAEYTISHHSPHILNDVET